MCKRIFSSLIVLVLLLFISTPLALAADLEDETTPPLEVVETVIVLSPVADEQQPEQTPPADTSDSTIEPKTVTPSADGEEVPGPDENDGDTTLSNDSSIMLISDVVTDDDKDSEDVDGESSDTESTPPFEVPTTDVTIPPILSDNPPDLDWVDVRSGWGFYTEFKKGTSNFRFTEEDFDIEFGENQYVIDRPVTIDFNGRTAIYTGDGRLFEVTSVLTIYGDGAVIATNASDAPIRINGGGLIFNGDTTITNEAGAHAIVVCGDGTFVMNNGEITETGAKNPENGGAVYVSNGTMIMNGGKLTENTAVDGGAIYVGKDGTVVINAGEISSNTAADNGGGIYVAPEGTLVVNGGLISGNTANAVHPVGGWGGGGIYTAGDFTMTGGTVTGNTAIENGGGINTDVRDWSHRGTTLIIGGEITNNTAGREGGGIYFGWDAALGGTIGNPTIISGNRANTSFDWGGGGIMVQTGVTLHLTNAVVTENTANGFGGGVAGCPSSQVQVFTINGAAIYSNIANGVGLTSRDESDHKTDDQLAAGSELFMGNGYQDFYCENNSIVYGDFLGGGNANWEGSCDTGIVKIGDGYYVIANDRMGLTANPSVEDIARAMEIAEVIIRDNYSNTHGGGIMCNGIIIMGTEVPGIPVTPEDPITPTPTSTPTPTPTEEPSSVPTAEPSPSATPEPTASPSPSDEPSPNPSEEPTTQPSVEPSIEPTPDPTETPSAQSSVEPTVEPTPDVSAEPPVEITPEPSVEPTVEPSYEPSIEPSIEPSTEPPVQPTEIPSYPLTEEPIPQPSETPIVEEEDIVEEIEENETPLAPTPSIEPNIEEDIIEPPIEEEEPIIEEMEDIDDEDTPLASEPINIEDEGVPLESIPITGDNGWIWYTILTVSALGLISIAPTLKKEKS